MQYALEQQVLKSLEKMGVAGGSRVGVAVSGGVDSMALLQCLCKLRAQMNILITAYHMEHGIRPESADDMRFVMAQCAKRGVSCVAAREDVLALAARRRVSVETAARDARYAFLDEADEDFIATAHQMNDTAETVLLNLLRGSGLRGLAGIPEKRGKYIRPLLCVPRADIEAYAKAEGIEYVRDATNDDTGYTRNYVRHELLPRCARVNDGAVRNIARAAQLLAEDEEALIDIARQSGCLEAGPEGAQVDIAKLLALPMAVRKRAIWLAIGAHGSIADVESVHMDAALRLAESGKSGKRVQLGGRYYAAAAYGKLMIGRTSEKQYNKPFEPLSTQCGFGGWQFEAVEFGEIPVFGPTAEYFDLDAVEGAVFRFRQTGDSIAPLGMQGRKRLSDYLSDRKVPLHRRDGLTVLAKDNEVFWVVGVGVSETSRVRPGADILKINYRESGYARGHQADTVQ